MKSANPISTSLSGGCDRSNQARRTVISWSEESSIDENCEKLETFNSFPGACLIARSQLILSVICSISPSTCHAPSGPSPAGHPPPVVAGTPYTISGEDPTGPCRVSAISGDCERCTCHRICHEYNSCGWNRTHPTRLLAFELATLRLRGFASGRSHRIR